MVGWYHQLNGHMFEQPLEDGEGQALLVCCRSWVTKSQTQLGDWATTTTTTNISFTVIAKYWPYFPCCTVYPCSFSSVQFSCSVVSNSLWPHESQHARPPCPSSTPGVHSDSRPLSQWCHPAISSSVIPFSSCPQSLPASESFPMSQLFTWGGQSIGVFQHQSFQWTPRTDLP